jgi:hypothetical protein
VFTRLAELSVHGANVQEGQILSVAAEIGLEEQARATAEAPTNAAPSSSTLRTSIHP